MPGRDAEVAVETAERTVIVGRSAGADMVIADPTVAPRHAELVVTSRGRIHVTDCASTTGTWVRDGDSERWSRLRQAFVDPEDDLRFGDHLCRAGDVVARAAGPGTPRGDLPPGMASAAVVRRGRIERDPATGEIVRRRF